MLADLARGGGATAALACSPLSPLLNLYTYFLCSLDAPLVQGPRNNVCSGPELDFSLTGEFQYEPCVPELEIEAMGLYVPHSTAI